MSQTGIATAMSEAATRRLKIKTPRFRGAIVSVDPMDLYGGLRTMKQDKLFYTLASIQEGP